MADQPDFTQNTNQIINTLALGVQLGPFANGAQIALPYDLSQWASVSLIVDQTLGGAVNFTWVDPASGNFFAQRVLYTCNETLQLICQFRVQSPLMQVIFGTTQGGGASISAFGSNSPCYSDSYGYQNLNDFNLAATWVSGVLQVLGPLASSGKPSYLSLSVSGAANKGTLGYIYANNAGVDTFATLTDWGVMHVNASASLSWQGVVTLPPGAIALAWLPFTAGAYTVHATLTGGI